MIGARSPHWTVRPIDSVELPAAARLEALAFGSGEQDRGEVTRLPHGAATGAFDDTGKLLAKAHDRPQSHWFGGRLVPASGVAGVAVRPEARRQGLAEGVLAALLRSAHERGAVLSVLFRTVPGLYRRLGWHDVGALVWTAVPTLALAGLRVPREIMLRPAADADLAAMTALYSELARSGAGFLDRAQPMVRELSHDPAGSCGITLAEDAGGTLLGYMRWRRSAEHGPGATLFADELLGVIPPAYLALLSSLGSWGEVLPTTILRLAEQDPAGWLLPVDGARHATRTWMLRTIDAVAAIAARGWPAELHGELDLDVTDALCPWHAGPHRLVLEDGSGRLERGGRGTVAISSQGLAALYAGGTSAALLHRGGLLSGGDAATDAWLDQAAGGPRPILLDSF